MTRAFTISQDAERVDGAVTVTLRVRTAEAAFTDHVVNYAVRVDLRKTADLGEVDLRQNETTWILFRRHLDRAGVPPSSPKRKDEVVGPDGLVWLLEDVVADPLSVGLECRARRAAADYP